LECDRCAFLLTKFYGCEDSPRQLYSIFPKLTATDPNHPGALHLGISSMFTVLECPWFLHDTSSTGLLTIVANVAIAAGPAALRVKFALYCMQGWILEFQFPSQTLRKGPL